MSDSPRMILLVVLGALSALLMSPRLADAQVIGAEATWAALDVTAAVNSAIEESANGAELREKAVRRFSECSLMYGGLSTLASNADAKKNYVQAQLATMEIEAAIAKPLPNQRRLELEESAQRSVAMMLRALKGQGNSNKREVDPLLKSCKALNDLKEIKSAMQELP